MVDFTQQNFVALCPKCEAPHPYTTVRFPGGVNDSGYWRVTCANCSTAFLIRVVNPVESRAQFEVNARFDGDEPPPSLPFATDQVIHNLPGSDFAPSFDFRGAALYSCPKTGSNLEHAALRALRDNF